MKKKNKKLEEIDVKGQDNSKRRGRREGQEGRRWGVEGGGEWREVGSRGRQGDIKRRRACLALENSHAGRTAGGKKGGQVERHQRKGGR